VDSKFEFILNHNLVDYINIYSIQFSGDKSKEVWRWEE
jgi:hypothetical protein